MNDDEIAEQVEARSAKLLAPRGAEQAELAHGLDVVPGKGRIRVVLRRHRSDLLARKPAHELAGRQVLLVEVDAVVHVPEFEWDQRRRWRQSKCITRLLYRRSIG